MNTNRAFCSNDDLIIMFSRVPNDGSSAIHLRCLCAAVWGTQVRYVSCQHNLTQLGFNTAVTRLFRLRNPHCACVLEFEACPAFGDIRASNREFSLVCGCVIELIPCQACRTRTTAAQSVMARSSATNQNRGRSIVPRPSRRRDAAAAPPYDLNFSIGAFEPRSSLPNALQGLLPAIQRSGQASLTELHTASASGQRAPPVLAAQQVAQGRMIESPAQHTQERPAREIPIDENYDDEVGDNKKMQDAPDEEERAQARGGPSGGPRRSQVLPENYIDLGSSSSEESIPSESAASPMDVDDRRKISDEEDTEGRE